MNLPEGLTVETITPVFRDWGRTIIAREHVIRAFDGEREIARWDAPDPQEVSDVHAYFDLSALLTGSGTLTSVCFEGQDGYGLRWEGFSVHFTHGVEVTVHFLVQFDPFVDLGPAFPAIAYSTIYKVNP